MNHLDEFQLNEYLDNELGEAERHTVESHLASCSDCQAALTELQTLFLALDEVAEVELATDLSARVLAELRPPTTAWLRPFLLAQGAAVVGMVVWMWPTIQGWQAGLETAVALLQTKLTPVLPNLWQLITQWGTAVSQQIQLARPAIPLANNQWTLLIILALALWLTGNQLLLKDNT